MEKGFVIGILIILMLNISLTGCIEPNSIVSMSPEKFPPIIILMKKQDYLSVITADSGLNWSNVKIKSGNCNLPAGIIEAGDMITNCSGLLVLMWIPSNSLIGEWTFK